MQVRLDENNLVIMTSSGHRLAWMFVHSARLRCMHGEITGLSIRIDISYCALLERFQLYSTLNATANATLFKVFYFGNGIRYLFELLDFEV